MANRFGSQLGSTRFLYIQEGLAIGVMGAVAKTIFPTFPVLELYGFVAPLIAIAFGLKTWGNGKETIEKEPTSDDIPIR
jgi:hypothetical protein